MEKVIFATNQPQELALRFLAGKESKSQFGDTMQQMFSTTDGRVFYVSAIAGDAITEQLERLGVQPGEFVNICKAEVDIGRGRKQIRWQVTPAMSDAAEPPAERTPIVMKPTADGTTVAVAAPAIAAEPVAEPKWATVLLEQTNVMVDCYAKALKHASGYEGLIKPETVQSILISAFINLSKGGRA